MTHARSDAPVSTGVRYAIDADDNICSVDKGWAQFAAANDGPELAQPAIIGTSLWQYISDDTTLRLYQQIVSRVREGRSARFSLRCDGPDCRRLLEMTVRAGAGDTVEFETHTVRLDHRAPMALLSRSTPRSNQLLRVCAWCNRVHVGAGSDPKDWIEVEEAVKRMHLFELATAPQLTHGICEVCLESVMKTVENMDA